MCNYVCTFFCLWCESVCEEIEVLREQQVCGYADAFTIAQIRAPQRACMYIAIRIHVLLWHFECTVTFSMIQVTTHCAHVLSRNLKHGLARASDVDSLHAHELFTTGLEKSCSYTSTARRRDGMFLMHFLKMC